VKRGEEVGTCVCRSDTTYDTTGALAALTEFRNFCCIERFNLRDCSGTEVYEPHLKE